MLRLERHRGVVLAFVLGAATGVIFVAGGGGSEVPGVTTVSAAGTSAVPVSVLDGEPFRHTEGSRVAYVPRRVLLRGGRFDVVVHFHGASSNQEQNVDESGLPAVVVSVNEGAASGAYVRAVASPASFDAMLGHARRALVKARGREDVEPGRIALSSWSAGGGAIRVLLDREPDRFDGVLVADGIFSSFDDASSRTPAMAPLAPFVRFGRRAQAGEALFVVTHTDIDTPDYPSTPECVSAILGELGVEKGAAPAGEPGVGGDPTYAVDSAGLHVRGYDGKGREEHVAQIRALDRAYGLLRARWEGGAGEAR